MPLLSQSSVGAVSVTSSALNRVGTVEVSANTVSAELFVDNLPNLIFWAVQTGAGVPLEVVPQVALRSETGGASPDLDYIDLSAPIIMPAIGTPLLLNFQFPAAFMRLKISYTAVAPATQNITFVLNAFGP